MKINFLILTIFIFSISTFSQDSPTRLRVAGEVLTNESVIQMTKAGFSKDLILTKIRGSASRFELSVEGLIELKNSGVDESLIEAMMAAKPSENGSDNKTRAADQSYSDSDSRPPVVSQNGQVVLTPNEALRTAKTITLEKHSLQPSMQALEKELIKRPEWKRINLSLVTNRESADLYVEISFVHLSLITHRYTFRVFDNRTGTVIAAGETTSWGSLAENLARNIAKELDKVLVAK